jgi:hypothetical protein
MIAAGTTMHHSSLAQSAQGLVVAHAPACTKEGMTIPTLDCLRPKAARLLQLGSYDPRITLII